MSIILLLIKKLMGVYCFLFSAKPNSVFARAGSICPSHGGLGLNISKIIFHEKFDFNYEYNIALLKTTQKIKFSWTVQPIKMAVSAPRPGMIATISGFGSNSINETVGVSKPYEFLIH